MSTTTTNLELIKPEATDNVSLSDYNDNLEKIDNILCKVYPVGSIYMSVNSTSPAEMFGGTWERIQDKFLLSAGSTYTAGDTGGSATHKLSVAEMPAHNHKLMSGYVLAGGTNLNYDVLNYSRKNINSPGYKPADWFMSKTGGGQPHNNMPPYLAVYMWKRVA